MAKKADAHSNADFGSCGGSGGDPVMGGGASKGTGSGGGKGYHASPKSKENKKPPTAKSYAGFGGVGGKNTKSR